MAENVSSEKGESTGEGMSIAGAFVQLGDALHKNALSTIETFSNIGANARSELFREKKFKLTQKMFDLKRLLMLRKMREEDEKKADKRRFALALGRS